MKLHELEIGKTRTGMIRKRDPIAGGDRGICRFAKDLSGSASGEQRRVRAKFLTCAGRIEEADADDPRTCARRMTRAVASRSNRAPQSSSSRTYTGPCSTST